MENWDNGFNGADLVINGKDVVVDAKQATVAADYGSVYGAPGHGPRTVTISGGATLNATNPNHTVLAIGWSRGEQESTVTVTGEGSTLHTDNWSNIGNKAGTNGVLYVKDGGAFLADGHIALGFGEEASGRIDVDSGNLETGDGIQLQLGYAKDSKGKVILKNGSTATLNGMIVVAKGVDSTGRIEVDDSSLTAGAQLYLAYGKGTRGEFSLKNGSTATLDGQIIVGVEVDSTGLIEVDDSRLTASEGAELQLAYAVDSTGKVTLKNGSSATLGGNVLMGRNTGTTAEFNILSGSEATSNGQVVVGETDDSNATFTVDGEGSTYISNGEFDLGYASGAIGKLVVGNKAEATFNDDLLVGLMGNGVIEVNTGGKVTANTDVHIGGTEGERKGGKGSLIIDGAGSSFTVNDNGLFIGFSTAGTESTPSGSVTVSNGGTLTLKAEAPEPRGNQTQMPEARESTGDLTLGYGEGTYGVLAVRDNGSRVAVGGDLYAGYSGIGDIEVSGGASLAVDGAAYLGHGEGSSGVMTVADADVTLNGKTYIGYGGQGKMSIKGGGKVTAQDDVSLGHDTGSATETGTIMVNGIGSELDMSDSLLAVGYDSAGDATDGLNGGSVTIFGGASATVGELSVGHEAGGGGTVGVASSGQDGKNDTVASRLTVRDDATVGRGGKGVLIAQLGASVDIGGGLAIGVNDGSNGTMRVSRGATVSVGTEDGEGNYDGTISVAQNSGSTGTLIIGGDRTAGGDYERSEAGRVNAGTLAFGDGTGSLVFSVTDTDYTFGLDVTGGGAIEAYNGTVSLTGDYSEYDGDTNIHGGTLSVDTGTFTHSAIKVMDGATLAGSGTVSDVTLQDGSTVAPGGKGISTLTVSGGDLSFADGASYAVTVSSDGSSDLLAVKSTQEDEAPGIAAKNIGGAGGSVTTGGTVTLGGSSSLSVSRLASDTAGDFKVNTWYTILTADQGITGEFSEVSDDFAYLDTTVDYDDDTKVLLALTRNNTDFEDVVGSSNTNARNAARAVGSMDEDNPLYKKVLFLEEGDVDRTYQALSGETHAGMAGALVQSTAPTRRLVVNRMRQLTPGAGAAPAAVTRNATSYGAEAGSFFRDPEVWGQAYGSWSKLDGSDGASGMESTTGGVVIGADAETDGGWRTGVFGSFGMVDTDARDGSADSDADSYQLGVYSARSFGQMALRMGASYSWDDVSADRTVTVGGVRQDLEADYWARTAQAFVELGYQTWAGSTSLEPFIGQAILYQEIDSFTETGGSAALSVDGEDLTQGITTVGLRFGRDLEGLGAGMSNLHGAVAWQHVTGDLNAESTMRFASGGDAFSVTGSALDRNQAVLSLGLRTELTERSVLDIGYEGALSENSQSHGLQATYSIRF
ncbi:autotransporter outer membrane beta-barrel domain-containing protein [Rhodovulum sulfidophilum]|uniref:autotransporter outer membrane beta-barrel domain-containing protein n=1 Tax=Rhodovulum sulfidophilum TaxID=35806 RepID=UPI00138A4067|nr:autotransporter outer membrane beta-barrel domain-containing protein [Rhodovulum sulfidophilum]NDK35799.1 autotransporter domain-containing protein [Rhodovulum sulfidophilum]